MSFSKLEAAEDRLSQALTALGMAVEQRLTHDEASHDLELQLRLAHEDRAELAERLDASALEIKRIEGTSREVSLKLDNAMETIRGVLSARSA